MADFTYPPLDPETSPAPLSPTVPLNPPMVGELSPFDRVDGQNRDQILEAIRAWGRGPLRDWTTSWQEYLVAWALQNQAWLDGFGIAVETFVNAALTAQSAAIAEALAAQIATVTAQLAAQDATVDAKIAQVDDDMTALSASVADAVQQIINSTIAITDPVVSGLLTGPSTTRTVLDGLMAPVTTDTESNRAFRMLSAASVYEANFMANKYTASGTGLTKQQAFTNDSMSRDADGRTILAKTALTNLLPNLPLAGAALGVIPNAAAPTGTGALPTGWGNANSSVQKEVIAFDAVSVTLKITASGGSFGGVRLPAMSPTGPVVASFELGSGSLPALNDVPAYAYTAWFNGGVETSSTYRYWWSGDAQRRITLALPQPAAGSNLAINFAPGPSAPAGQILIVRIANPRVDLASDVSTNIIGQPPYSATPITLSTVILRVPDGAYVVVARTSTGTYWRKRATAAAGAGIDLAATFGFVTVERVFVIPDASWTTALADLLPLAEGYNWQSPVVQLVNNLSSGALVSRALNHAQPQNTTGEVTGASGDSAALRSIKLSQTLPGAMRFNVQPGDLATNGDHVGQERAEVHVPDKMPFDTDVWVSIWFKVNSYARDTAADPSSSIMQFRYTNDPGDTTGLSPEFTLRLYPKEQTGDAAIPSGYVRLFVVTNSSTAAPPVAVNNLVVRGKHDLQIGVWHHVVGRMKFNQGGGGELQYWVDGAVEFNAAIPLGHNRINGPQLRCGIYSNTHNTATRDVEIRDVEYGITPLTSRVTAVAPL